MPCEAEMRSYHLLTLMGTHGRYGYDGTEYGSALAVSMNSCLNQSQLAGIPVPWHAADCRALTSRSMSGRLSWSTLPMPIIWAYPAILHNGLFADGRAVTWRGYSAAVVV
jgi:hypothetical protein